MMCLFLSVISIDDYLRKTFRQVSACIHRDMNTWFGRRLDDTRARSRRCLSYSCQSLPSQLLQYAINVTTLSSDVCMHGRIQKGRRCGDLPDDPVHGFPLKTSFDRTSIYDKHLNYKHSLTLGKH